MAAKAFSKDQQQRLRERLAGFAFPLEITLTIDPSRFVSPLAAYETVMRKRRLSEFVRTLWRKGKLSSRRFMWVLEFHETGWPHWHIVVDAKAESKANQTPFIYGQVIRGAWRHGITKPIFRPERQLEYLLKSKQKSPPDWLSGKQIRWFDHDKVHAPLN